MLEVPPPIYVYLVHDHLIFWIQDGAHRGKNSLIRIQAIGSELHSWDQDVEIFNGHGEEAIINNLSSGSISTPFPFSCSIGWNS